MNIKENFKDLKYITIGIWAIAAIIFLVMTLIYTSAYLISYYVFNYTVINDFRLGGIIVFVCSCFLAFYVNEITIKKLFFYCSNCLEKIYLYKINDFTCPECEQPGKSYKHLLKKCDCGEEIDFYECPHCKHEIDLLAEYNENQLRIKRKERR
ncbi:MAG: hypothetical protein P4L27_05445 [Ignavibacteriaceae bacterium]|nr:hypothetical protein [Ignavibacteriaceae bacterium]